MKKSLVLLALVVFSVPAAVAQTFWVGNRFVQSPRNVAVELGTNIDQWGGAMADGTLTTAGFALDSAGPCPAAVKIKIFRRQAGTLTMLAERGPFDYLGSDRTVALSPPIDVVRGDMIGLTTLTPCGHPVAMLAYWWGVPILHYAGDVTGSVAESAAVTLDGDLAVWASGTVVEPTSHVARIVPVVGSAIGAMGSHWKTSLQLMNPYPAASAGELVFHRAGEAASSSDRTLPYHLAAGGTQTIPDVVAAMGESGLGSIDVVTDGGGDSGLPPVVVAHIFNDGGDGGSFGLSEEAVDPEEGSSECAAPDGAMIATRVLRRGVSGVLVAPSSMARSRLNIGVRTLAEGATITATVQSSTGQAVQSVTRTYPANYFEQRAAQDFLGTSLAGEESITIFVAQGAAIVYATSVDNTTNDPAMQHVFGVLKQQ